MEKSSGRQAPQQNHHVVTALIIVGMIVCGRLGCENCRGKGWALHGPTGFHWAHRPRSHGFFGHLRQSTWCRLQRFRTSSAGMGSTSITLDDIGSAYVKCKKTVGRTSMPNLSQHITCKICLFRAHQICGKSKISPCSNSVSS